MATSHRKDLKLGHAQREVRLNSHSKIVDGQLQCEGTRYDLESCCGRRILRRERGRIQDNR
jgi:hypothetical protein